MRDTPWEYAHPNESVTQLKETAVRNHGNVEPGPLADPVCGMTVDAKQAEAKALTSRHDARDYFFCGRGCKLEFDEDPGRFLDPAHTPSM